MKNIFLLLITGIFVLFVQPVLSQTTWTINTTSDDGDYNITDPNPYCDVDGTLISLRSAIEQANYTGGTYIFKFNIGTEGTVQTIYLEDDLEAIDFQVTIDGWTQDDFDGDPDDYQGSPLIVLDGSGLMFNSRGLRLQSGASSSTIRGLAVVNFYNVAGIYLYECDSTSILGCSFCPYSRV